jgi:hypothetical protein
MHENLTACHLIPLDASVPSKEKQRIGFRMLEPNAFAAPALLEAEREQDLSQLTVGHTLRHRLASFPPRHLGLNLEAAELANGFFIDDLLHGDVDNEPATRFGELENTAVAQGLLHMEPERPVLGSVVDNQNDRIRLLDPV